MAFLKSSRKRYSLWFMNIAQFGAVVNDNIYKLVMVFMLIDFYGTEYASNILSQVGVIYVIPFLLFSSAAGILADRYSKKWMLSLLKMAEVAIFGLSIFVVMKTTPWASFLALFFLATHSAAFGPPKYSIIPELVSKEKVPKANGLITSCTYLGIIFGTFLASFLAEITDCNYVLVMIFCLSLAVLGLLSAFCIPTTPPQHSRRKIQWFFFKEIYHTLRLCQPEPHLLLALFSSAFFLFVGSYTQLNIIPYTLQALKLSEIYGGYLFLCTALGIAAGSLCIGKLLKKSIALWIPCAAGFGLAFFLFLLAFCSSSLPLVIIFLFCLGIVGGMFIVPLDSFIQLSCSNETRGHVIAVGNFLGFCGVLISSLLLYFLSSVIRLSSMAGFGVVSFLTLLYAFFLFFRFSDFTLPLLVKQIIRPSLTIQMDTPILLGTSTLVLYEGSLYKCALLGSIAPQYDFVFVDERRWMKKTFLKLFYSVHVLRDSANPIEELKSQSRPLCFVLPEKAIPPSLLYESAVEIIPPPPHDPGGPTIIQFKEL